MPGDRRSSHRLRSARGITFVSLALGALSVGALAAPAPGAQASPLHEPLDAHGNLLGVAAIAANDVWGVGTRPGHPWHVIVRHWSGTAWGAAKAPALGAGGNEALYGVAGVSSKDVWAVGRAFLADGQTPRPIIEHWDGSRWSVADAPGSQESDQLAAVVAINRRDVWAVGQQGSAPVQPLIDHWGGHRWTTVTTPSMPGYTLDAVSATGSDDVWAVGQNATDQLSVVEHWDGTSWTVSDNSTVTGGYVTLGGVVAFTPTNVHAIGDSDGGPFEDVWDGTQWTQEESGLSPADSLFAASATSPDDIWGVGGDGFEDTFAAHWDGSAWKSVKTQTPPSKYAYFNSVSMSEPDDAWAVGLYRVGTHRYCLTEHWDGSRWLQVTC